MGLMVLPERKRGAGLGSLFQVMAVGEVDDELSDRIG